MHDLFGARVRAIAQHRLACPVEAQDVAQQVWLKVFEQLPAYQTERRSFEAWLVKVAQNTAEDHWRRMRRADRWAPEDLDTHRDAIGQTDPEWGAASNVHAALTELPQAQQDALTLLYRWDLGVDATAAAMGRTEVSTRQLHSRALRTLRASLDAT